MSDGVTVDIRVDAVQAKRFLEAMQRRAGLLRESMSAVVKWGAYFVAKSAATATRVAPKTRKIIDNAAWKTAQHSAARNFTAPYFAVRDFARDEAFRFIPVFASTRSQAKESRQAQVKYRGLAQRIWTVLAAKSAANATLGSLAGAAGKAAEQRAATLAGFEANVAIGNPNPTIRLSHRAKYATAAFKTTGRATVDNILGRAAGAMARDAEYRMRKAERGLAA